jgi:hypothetical protein
VGGLEKLEAAELHEGDVAPGELDLEAHAVVGGAEQHRLGLEPEPGFAAGQHLIDHPGGLVGLVAQRHEPGFFAGDPLAPEILAEALLRLGDHGVGGGQDGLGGAVVAVEGDAPGGCAELAGKVEDVAHRGAAEAVDGLGVVADHGEAAPVGPHGQQQPGLQAVGVLEFVHQDVAEARADLAGELGFGDHLRPVEEQVVVVEHLLGLLGFDVGEEEVAQLLPQPAHQGSWFAGLR